MAPLSSRPWTPVHHSADGEREWKPVGELYEPGQAEGLTTSVHVSLVELSHMAILTARDAGKYSQDLCPGRRGNAFGEYLVHLDLVMNSLGPSNGPAFLEFWT